MTAKKLSFETGVVEYDLNGAVKVRFNPTDSAFIEKLYNTFDDLSAKQEEYQKAVDDIGDDGRAMFEYASERDKEMRGIIDGLLGKGVSKALFKDMNCYAMSDGLPVWINLMFAVAEEIESALTEEQKKNDPRMAKYSKKYESMQKKYARKKK